MSLYEDLLQRLRVDAAAAINEYRRANGVQGHPVGSDEVLVARNEDGRWRACVDRPGNWLSIRVTGYASETEALCALIERAQADAHGAGGILPLHLLDQLESDAEALAVYRAQLGTIVKGNLPTLAAALSDYAAVMHALELLRARGET